MKNVQFISWFPEWHGIHFTNGNPKKKPSAFHLIYKWSIWVGYWEIRKFLTDEEMGNSLKIYKEQKL
jgi:hypothetical protein